MIRNEVKITKKLQQEEKISGKRKTHMDTWK